MIAINSNDCAMAHGPEQTHERGNRLNVTIMSNYIVRWRSSMIIATLWWWLNHGDDWRRIFKLVLYGLAENAEMRNSNDRYVRYVRAVSTQHKMIIAL